MARQRIYLFQVGPYRCRNLSVNMKKKVMKKVFTSLTIQSLKVLIVVVSKHLRRALAVAVLSVHNESPDLSNSMKLSV